MIAPEICEISSTNMIIHQLIENPDPQHNAFLHMMRGSLVWVQCIIWSPSVSDTFATNVSHTVLSFHAWNTSAQSTGRDSFERDRGETILSAINMVRVYLFGRVLRDSYLGGVPKVCYPIPLLSFESKSFCSQQFHAIKCWSPSWSLRSCLSVGQRTPSIPSWIQIPSDCSD